MKPETKFWHELRKKTKNISWIRLENLSVPGTPDLLGYNNSGHFFTVELKYSPHQIAFHVKHPENTFVLIMQKTPSSCLIKLYEGKRIRQLVACGLTLEPLVHGMDSCLKFLSTLGA